MNLTQTLEKIQQGLAPENPVFDQIAAYDVMVNDLKKIVTLEKPVYNYPQIDTLGRDTYPTLNVKSN